MKLLDKYIFSGFSSTFFSIFFTLYIITSIIFLVKIATLTSVIQINFLELVQLYSFTVPTILFYTLPISYFIGITVTIAKLSLEYEIIVITSFGLKPAKLLNILLPYTMLISVLLLIISLGLIPKAQYLKDTLLNIKKQEAKFNIKASEYGQQLGSWLVYVNKGSDRHFQDITLLQLTKNKSLFISADWASMENTDDTLSLILKEGKSFSISENIQQVNFEEMILNHTIAKVKNIKSLNDIIIYWSNRKNDEKRNNMFPFYILISTFPLLSIFFYVAIGYSNPRYETKHSTVISLLFIVFFVVIVNKFTILYPDYSLLIIPFVWFFIGYLYYTFTAKKHY